MLNVIKSGLVQESQDSQMIEIYRMSVSITLDI